ncbi:hypothetical protein ALI22I_34755 [Saccharothrix sp. ALI-22-I]|uniref:hypothetical protein n=1 Tax=Saccharothrix sp. ALI-22-I TaxID=1933778 RepID=UPI00097C9ECF|nr:hypothetical protein [Saccharothrix sp. ALI-22-I]ONI83633.1 hypothetical protein ALI22I_34755 [Saccharothrix sp. ALI-22-I]
MTDLLGDLAELRRRAREDRHAYPFPLLFFGIASFLAIPLYAPSNPVVRQVEWNPLSVLGAHTEVRHPLLLGLYWPVVLLVGALATAWWYHRRGARVGIETSTRGYLGALAIGLGSPLVSMGLIWLLPRTAIGFWGQGPATGIGAIVIAAATVLWRWRAPRVLTLTAAVLGTAVLQYAQSAIGQFIAIGLGLVVLAAVERSTRFTTITAAYLVALCLSAAFTPLTLTPATAWSLGSVVMLPGFALVVGGLVGLRRG